MIVIAVAVLAGIAIWRVGGRGGNYANEREQANQAGRELASYISNAYSDFRDAHLVGVERIAPGIWRVIFARRGPEFL